MMTFDVCVAPGGTAGQPPTAPTGGGYAPTLGRGQPFVDPHNPIGAEGMTQ